MVARAVTLRAVVLPPAAGGGLGHRLSDFVARPLTIVLVVVLLGCSLTLTALRRRAVRRHATTHRSDHEQHPR